MYVHKFMPYLQGRMMRPGGSMSFGSYQQYQQYRDQLRQNTASSGDALAARMSLLAQLQAAGGAGNVGGLPASFYTTSTPPAYPTGGMQLHQSFFGSQDSVGKPHGETCILFGAMKLMKELSHFV